MNFEKRTARNRKYRKFLHSRQQNLMLLGVFVFVISIVCGSYETVKNIMVNHNRKEQEQCQKKRSLHYMPEVWHCACALQFCFIMCRLQILIWNPPAVF